MRFGSISKEIKISEWISVFQENWIERWTLEIHYKLSLDRNWAYDMSMNSSWSLVSVYWISWFLRFGKLRIYIKTEIGYEFGNYSIAVECFCNSCFVWSRIKEILEALDSPEWVLSFCKFWRFLEVVWSRFCILQVGSHILKIWGFISYDSVWVI